MEGGVNKRARDNLIGNLLGALIYMLDGSLIISFDIFGAFGQCRKKIAMKIVTSTYLFLCKLV